MVARSPWAKMSCENFGLLRSLKSWCLVFVQETGESALHAASREGLVDVVQTMCSLGCKVDTISAVSVCLSVSLFKSCVVLAVRSRELVCGGCLSVCFSVQIMCGLGCSVEGISAMMSVCFSVQIMCGLGCRVKGIITSMDAQECRCVGRQIKTIIAEQ